MAFVLFLCKKYSYNTILISLKIYLQIIVIFKQYIIAKGLGVFVQLL